MNSDVCIVTKILLQNLPFWKIKKTLINLVPYKYVAMRGMYDVFWRDMKTQTRITGISVPLYRGQIFYTYDSLENKISIFHPKEGVFALSKYDFERIDKKAKKLLTVDSSYDQFFLLSTIELCGFSIMKNYFDLKRYQMQYPKSLPEAYFLNRQNC